MTSVALNHAPSRARAAPRPAATGLGPFTSPDLRRYLVRLAISSGLLFAAYRGTSTEAMVDRQMAWVALGIGAVGVSALAAGGLLLVGYLQLARRRRSVTARLEAIGRPRPAASDAGDVLVANDRMSLYHRRSCQLSRHKAVVASARREHESAGRHACPVCRP